MSLYKRNGSPIYWYKFEKDGKSYQRSTRTDDLGKAEAIYRMRRAEVGSVVQSNSKLAMPDPGVYFLHSRLAGLTKIGCSGNVPARIGELQTANPEELLLLGTIKADRYLQVEQLIHELFEAKRVRGEWFRITDEDVDFALKYWERVKDANRVMEMYEGMPVEQDRLYTADEVAAVLNLSVTTVRKWMNCGKLPKIQLGHAIVRVQGKALRDFIYKHSTPALEFVPATPLLPVSELETVTGTNA